MLIASGTQMLWRVSLKFKPFGQHRVSTSIGLWFFLFVSWKRAAMYQVSVFVFLFPCWNFPDFFLRRFLFPLFPPIFLTRKGGKNDGKRSWVNVGPGNVITIRRRRALQRLREILIGLGFLQSVSYVKPLPTHEKLFAVGNVAQTPPLTYFFLGWDGLGLGVSSVSS